ncbi:uncharacterized protein LOC125520993 [Triticum urartu]|uniref:uncharacterized protein LOC125520993 n=1 Tax=Triticum urartu TaxID=4572 RepID=UPI002042C25B|nr:uncharacterized protein LOC125520993 [Triticum urartu]XP_048541987.1 uncharacterized protein LOC125520993 [Triticum urartu]
MPPKRTKKIQSHSSNQGKQQEQQGKQEKKGPTPRWRQQSEARVRKNKQHSMKDVKVFKIDVNATQEQFDQFTEDRINHMRNVASAFVNGAPVTPPYIKDCVTYHIVRLTDTVGKGPSVDILIQEYNLYMIGFRATRTNADDGGGWFHFAGEVMPKFMTSLPITYSSSYSMGSLQIRLGFGVLDEIRIILLGFTVQNRLDKTSERLLSLSIAPYMLSETVRLQNARNDAGRYILHKIREVLPLVNQWADISHVAFDYVISLNSKVLERAAKTYNLRLCLELEGPVFTYELRLLVGPEGYLRVLLYDEDYVASLIEKREKDNPPSQTLEIRNLDIQGESFKYSELQEELWKQCCRFGNVVSLDADEDHNVIAQFSHPKAADEAKIFFDGSIIGGRVVEAVFSPSRR